MSLKDSIMKITFRFSTVFLFLALAGLSLTSATCNPDTDPAGLGPNEMQAIATVEGSFFANDAFAVNGPSYAVEASMPYAPISGDIKITLSIPKNVTVPYTRNVSSTDAVIDYCLETSNSCVTYRASKTAGSGTITVTSISPYLEGTFSGTLTQIGGAQSRVISNGEFKVGF